MFKGRLLVLVVLQLAVFVGITGRLACLQVAQHEHYEEWAVNRCRWVEVYETRRGRILTSDGKIVARDREVWDVAAYMPELDVETNVARLIARYSDFNENIIRDEFDVMLRRYWSMPVERRPAGMPFPCEISEKAARSVRYYLEKYPERYNDSVRIKTYTDKKGEEKPVLYVNPLKLDRMRKVVTRICRLVNRNPDDCLEKLDAYRERVSGITNGYQRRYEEKLPVPIIKDVSFDVVSAVTTDSEGALYRGLVIKTRRERFYPGADAYSHVLGYMRPITAEEYSRFKEEDRVLYRGIKVFENLDRIRQARCFFVDDTVGARGVESVWDDWLAGNKGVKIRERNPATVGTREIATQDPSPGRDVTLTIDSRVQEAAHRAFIEEGTSEAPAVGCAVVMDVHNGEILCLVTAPSFDPNTFRRPEEYARLSEPPYGLITRPVSSAFPPGSTFKILSAVAGLEEGAITEDTTHFCRGYLHRPGAFRCEGRHGHISVHDAIVVSCNVFFYNLGEALARPDEQFLQKWAFDFGFGEKTGIDLTGETSGVVPTPELKERRLARAEANLAEKQSLLIRRTKELQEEKKKDDPDPEVLEDRKKKIAKLERNIEFWKGRVKFYSATRAWVKGDGRNMAIGQGDLAVTPLQIARFNAAVANGGRVLRPHVVRGGDRSNVVRELDVRDSNLALVRRALYDVVHSSYPRGTAYGRGLDEYRAAAKTGTAETGRGELNHAYLAGFAPYDDPSVAFVVMLENTPKHGSGTSAILKKILDAVFEARKIRKGREPR